MCAAHEDEVRSDLSTIQLIPVAASVAVDYGLCQDQRLSTTHHIVCLCLGWITQASKTLSGFPQSRLLFGEMEPDKVIHRLSKEA